jgi:hypothetical protein
MLESLWGFSNIIRIALAVAVILLLPLLAMQITDEAAWGMADFAVVGALLFGAGLAYELITRKAGALAYRAAVGVALAAALLLVWMNLAVGLIGSEDNPANLMYIGVLAIEIIGALMARFRPRGMALALFATAIAQAVVPVIALIIGKLQVTSVEALWYVLGVLGVNALFVMLFVGSALLFRHANATLNRRHSAPGTQNAFPNRPRPRPILLRLPIAIKSPFLAVIMDLI